MNPFATIVFILLLTVCGSMSVNAADWPHWRGPNFDGSSSEGKLPDDFSKTNGVKWATSLPGPSAATPISWGDHIFLSSTDLKTKTLCALALDRKSGSVVWDNEVAPGFSQDERSNLASPSPTTDGERAYFFYSTGDLVAFDFSGKQIWSRNIQKDYGQFVYQWTYGASPTFLGGNFSSALEASCIAWASSGKAAEELAATNARNKTQVRWGGSV